jgi:hypothetical protein
MPNGVSVESIAVPGWMAVFTAEEVADCMAYSIERTAQSPLRTAKKCAILDK